MKAGKYNTPGGDSLDNSKNKKEEAGTSTFKPESVAAAVVIILIAAVVFTIFFNRKEITGRQYSACKSNGINIMTAIRFYAADNEGHFPPTLALLTPDYLRTLPTCPASEKNTYATTYRAIIDPADSSKDRFTFYCSGGSHKQWIKSEENHPVFTSKDGGMIIESLEGRKNPVNLEE